MDDTYRPRGEGPVESTHAAAQLLRADRPRARAARRLRLRDASAALDRLAELAARLLAAPIAQISLLDDVEVIVAGTGLPPGTVGREAPLDATACAVPAAEGLPVVVPDVRDEPRAADLPQVRAGVVGAYLGAPMIDADGFAVGVLCVAAPTPRTWADTDVATLRQLASAAVAELELAALRTEHERDRLRWGLAIDAAGIGTFDWDLRTGELTWDARLIAMFGYDVDSFGGTIEAFNERVHPDDLPRVTDALQASIAARGDYEAEYRVVWPGGETRWVQARGRTLADETGAATRVLGAAYDTTAERAAGMRVTRVLDAMPAGFYSLDREWRFTHVNAEAERLLQHSRDELLGQELWTAFPAAVNSVFEESYRTAVRTGTPVHFDAHYPAPLNGWYELRAWPSPEGLSVYFLEVTERRRVQDRAERAAQRLALLAQVSAELAGALDAQTATAHLPRLVVPALADWCIVTVVDPDGRPRDVGYWHVVPSSRALVERYAAVRLDAMPATAPLMRALLTGEAVMERTEAVRAVLADGEARDLLTALDPESAIAIPLRGRDRTLGVMTLYYRRGWTPRDEDLATAQDVADRAGLALDNARLYGQQRALAEGLQRSLLTEPPEPDHAEIAVRYLPAAEAARVGGDWYDAFLQPGGATMLVIGDVVGHDTEAAAAMGQLRALLRGIATYSDGGPGEVLRGLDASMALLQTRVLATATVARFEQTDDERRRGVTRMRWANAGHLPPLVINPDGSVAELATWRGDLLLGVDPDALREESVVTLDRGATVLLFTDGLIERRDADLDAGMARLREALRELADRPLEELLDEVLHRLVDGRPEDDVALVAVRLHRQDQPRPPEAGPNRVPDVVPEDPMSPVPG
ncbi:Serine phosphatase RsbU, regulator of sigma subunit [Geodermatophilus amargosae]|uniref:Serine phosphatase RsbU, regulator of sigma subunit n=1 Tax=Geodermatophilus amargosae TaxID=1296565 RepID=A0A1I7D460_9ACTN|nr:SpoIIE family protein phosphatase [Geodermatophilus amargosae]SFU06488.1 Serine phosphatase RsbU, regulator of sigma subunit [Geodermatophilus amargosae]